MPLPRLWPRTGARRQSLGALVAGCWSASVATWRPRVSHRRVAGRSPSRTPTTTRPVRSLCPRIGNRHLEHGPSCLGTWTPPHPRPGHRAPRRSAMAKRVGGRSNVREGQHDHDCRDREGQGRHDVGQLDESPGSPRRSRWVRLSRQRLAAGGRSMIPIPTRRCGPWAAERAWLPWRCSRSHSCSAS